MKCNNLDFVKNFSFTVSPVCLIVLLLLFVHSPVVAQETIVIKHPGLKNNKIEAVVLNKRVTADTLVKLFQFSFFVPKGWHVVVIGPNKESKFKWAIDISKGGSIDSAHFSLVQKKKATATLEERYRGFKKSKITKYVDYVTWNNIKWLLVERLGENDNVRKAKKSWIAFSHTKSIPFFVLFSVPVSNAAQDEPVVKKIFSKIVVH